MLPGDKGMNKIIINSQDIKEAENVLGLEEGFDEQRQDVIKCVESKDIVACPGSGKTTTLLAKLIILAKKMPFPDNKGICVLTHTNVAINEIKDKLGSKASLILSYPNYVGTIQSFVDRYLAIPACIKYFGVRPCIIDTDYFNSHFLTVFNSIYGNRLFNGFEFFCKRNGLSVNDLRLSICDDVIYKKNKIFNFTVGIDKKYEDKIKNVFIRLYNSGILRYETALEIGEKYISEFQEELEKVFSERFIAVFIDEMQDTDDVQMRILNKVFNKKTTVIQCYGDPNQAIYDFLGSQEGNWTPKDRLTITNSRRFHNNIAHVSDFVSLTQCRYNMKGTGESRIPPIIITYANNDVSKVLENFAKLVIHYKLTSCEKPVFKAVGMVRGKNDKLGIKSYFSSFGKTDNRKNSNKDYPALCQYLAPVDVNNNDNRSASTYYNRFINAILKTLRLANIRSEQGKLFSKRSLLRYLHERDPMLLDKMNRLFVRFIIRIEKGKDVTRYFKYFLKVFLRKAFNACPNKEVIEFWENFSEFAKNNPISSPTNVYEYNGVQIEIDTVHAVKGQTHTATLYMETFWYKKTVENIIEYIRGESKRNPVERVKKQLKIAYVAMTRPRELLCITMEDTVFGQNKDKLTALGWVHYKDILKDGRY